MQWDEQGAKVPKLARLLQDVQQRAQHQRRLASTAVSGQQDGPT
jgi:hypothetical protein